MKHSPGPWKVQAYETDYGDHYAAQDAQGRTVAFVSTTNLKDAQDARLIAAGHAAITKATT